MTTIKKIGGASQRIDSIAKAKNLSMDQVTPDSNMATSLAKFINSSPDLQAVVRTTGFTVDSYAAQFARVVNAVIYNAIGQQVGGSGSNPLDELPGFRKPSAQDIAFVRAHADELKTAGFPVPQITQP